MHRILIVPDIRLKKSRISGYRATGAIDSNSIIEEKIISSFLLLTSDPLLNFVFKLCKSLHFTMYPLNNVLPSQDFRINYSNDFLLDPKQTVTM